MTTWTLEPRDTLVARDGNPMSGASQMTSLALPWPSSTAGFVRTRVGSDEHGRWSGDLLSDDAKKIPVVGPWIVELDATGNVTDALLPRPLDLVGWDATEKEKIRVVPLRPQPRSGGVMTDLDGEGLELLGLIEAHSDKPTSLPALVSWNGFFADWLARPTTRDVVRSTIGIAGLEREWRTHVAIDPETQTAKEGDLFSVEHLRFVVAKAARTADGALPHRSYHRLAVAVQCADLRLKEKRGTYPWAGERRLSSFAPAAASGVPQHCPKPIEDAIAQSGRARVVLVTPAIFKSGWKPGLVLAPDEGVTPKLIAAAVQRADVVSGWDLATNKPKPTRRVVPAGSVYWVQLDGDEAARRAWVKRWWWTAISDQVDERLQGFGLCVLGTGGESW